MFAQWTAVILDLVKNVQHDSSFVKGWLTLWFETPETRGKINFQTILGECFGKIISTIFRSSARWNIGLIFARLPERQVGYFRNEPFTFTGIHPPYFLCL